MKDCSIYTLYFIICNCKYINSILINYKAKNLSHWLLELMSFALYFYPRNFPIMHILNIWVTTEWSIVFYRYIFTVWYKLETLHLKVKSMLRTMPKFYGHCSRPSWVKGHQSEPPIQNLARMTLNKLDYSNCVQWNLQEACHQNQHTLLTVVTVVTHVTKFLPSE